MNPDELLAQIKELLQQYLSLGEETPVAAEAAALDAAIDQTMGGDEGAPPPEGGEGAAGMLGGLPPGPPMEGGLEEVPQENTEGMPPPAGGPEEALASMVPEGPESPPRGFGEASAMALGDMKKKRSKASY